jgi:trans-aconitate methyltransferase
MSHATPGSFGPTLSVRWDAADYHRHASAQTGWGRDLHARLSLRGDERLLDLGCGDGRLTADLAARVPRGEVTGIDADPDMVAFARSHHQRSNLAFVQADVRRFAVEGPVDVVVSSACLHWVTEHEAVLERCRAHLETGGRLLFQMGGRGSCAELADAVLAAAADPRLAAFLKGFTLPWNFLGPEDYLTLLPRCRFRPRRVELLEKDMVHDGPQELRSWMRTTWMPVLARLPDPLRPALLDAVIGHHLTRRPPDAAGRTHVAMFRLEVEAEAE